MRRSRGASGSEAQALEVTRMRRRHLRGVMAIERRVYARPWSPNLFAAEITDPNGRCYLVARVHKEIVGYGGLICYGDEAHITHVACAPRDHPRHRDVVRRDGRGGRAGRLPCAGEPDRATGAPARAVRRCG